MTWKQKVRQLLERLGRRPTIDELITEARKHKMTAEEVEAQRQSWARANISTGDPRFD